MVIVIASKFRKCMFRFVPSVFSPALRVTSVSVILVLEQQVSRSQNELKKTHQFTLSCFPLSFKNSTSFLSGSRVSFLLGWPSFSLLWWIHISPPYCFSLQDPNCLQFEHPASAVPKTWKSKTTLKMPPWDVFLLKKRRHFCGAKERCKKWRKTGPTFETITNWSLQVPNVCT